MEDIDLLQALIHVYGPDNVIVFDEDDEEEEGEN